MNMNWSLSAFLMLVGYWGCIVVTVSQGGASFPLVGDLLNSPTDGAANIATRWLLCLSYLVGALMLMTAASTRRWARTWDAAVLSCALSGFLHVDALDIGVRDWAGWMYYFCCSVAVLVMAGLLRAARLEVAAWTWSIYHGFYALLWLVEAEGVVTLPEEVLAASTHVSFVGVHVFLFLVVLAPGSSPTLPVSGTASDPACGACRPI